MRRLTVGLVTLVMLLGVGRVCADSIIINGSFEEPMVRSNGSFDIFATMPGWQSGDVRGFEVHRYLNGWLPYDGDQYIENTSSVNTFQALVTDPGTSYILSYAYSPRPGHEENPLDVYWNGNLVSSHAESGIGNANTLWTLYQFEVLATGLETLLEFRSERLDGGTYLDAVNVTALDGGNAVPAPSSLVCLVGVGAMVGGMEWWKKRRDRVRATRA